MDGEALRKITADLREARRYVRSDIAEARRQTKDCVLVMCHQQGSAGEKAAEILQRLGLNHLVGRRFAQVMPDMLASYLSNAAFELECLAGPIEVPEVAEPAA